MSGKNNQNYFDDTIVINNILSDNSEDIITIHSKNLCGQYLDKYNSYKVSPEGKIAIDDLNSNLNKNSKEMLIKELIDYDFENIPDNLTKLELKNILEYSTSNILKDIRFAKTEPFSVEIADNGDLKIILLVYNGNSIVLNLGEFPLKLKDANNKVIVADFIDLNLEVSSGKIGICYLKLNKEILKEENMDLTTWTITFEV